MVSSRFIFFFWGLFIITAKPFVCLPRIVSLLCFRRTTVDPTLPRATRNPQIAAHHSTPYEVATISRLLKITGLFCRISSLLQGSFERETSKFKEPSTRSHPIPNGVGSFVRVAGLWPFGGAPLPNVAGSYARVAGRWPVECAPCPMGQVRL